MEKSVVLQAESGTPYVEWWQQARNELTRADPKLGLLIFKLSEDGLCPSGKPFLTLVQAIIAQQLSKKASENIWHKFQNICPVISPEAIMRKHRRSLRTTGVSERKIDYIYELCQLFIEEKLTLEDFEKLEDDAIVKKLCSLNGIGFWTAQMFLIFTLGRPDVLPMKDLGLIKALAALYFPNIDFRDLPAMGRQAEIKAITDKWRPWRTAATWYLWKSLTEMPISNNGLKG